MTDNFDTFYFSELCPECHKTWYLGFSGFEQGNMLVCYLCPSCNNESMDFMPKVDDSLPKYLAWSRENGKITWHTGPAIKGNLGDELIFDGFREYADWWISGEERDYLIHESTSMIETVISDTERLYTFTSVYGPLDDRLRVTINALGLYEAEFIE